MSINTMSIRRVNIEANFQVMDFTLTRTDIDRIDAMNRTGHRIVDKSQVPWVPTWD